MSVNLGARRGSQQLWDTGFIRFNPAEQLEDIDVQSALEGLRQDFADLPPDSYGKGRYRYRRHTRAVLVPGERERGLLWLPHVHDEQGTPVSEYYQADFNPEFIDARRQFPTLTEQTKNNPLLRHLIWYDWALTFWDERASSQPFQVGIHFIKLKVAQEDERAISSPNSLHQDGETFTFAHLVTRKNVVGGGNVIAPAACSGLHPEDLADRLILARFELIEPLDSYGVYDKQVSHFAGAVERGLGPEPAERGVILIDFTPMIPQI